MGLRWAVAGCLGIALLAGAACDPLTGTGPGTAPDPKGYMHSDPATRAVVVTLIAGYPAGDYQFNYNGYRDGTLVIGIPVGWQVTVQCENHATACSTLPYLAATGLHRWWVATRRVGCGPTLK